MMPITSIIRCPTCGNGVYLHREGKCSCCGNSVQMLLPVTEKPLLNLLVQSAKLQTSIAMIRASSALIPPPNFKLNKIINGILDGAAAFVGGYYR